MEASVEARFVLGAFSPEALTFLPGLNCVLASSQEGGTRCIDMVNGLVQRGHGMCGLFVTGYGFGLFIVITATVIVHLLLAVVMVAMTNWCGARN